MIKKQAILTFVSIFIILGCNTEPTAEDKAVKVIEMAQYNFNEYRSIKDDSKDAIALCKEKMTVASDLMAELYENYSQTQAANEFVTVRLKQAIEARLEECTPLYSEGS